MAPLTDLSSLDATALADLVRSRSISPLELVEATTARIEQINPSLNATVTPMYDQARAAAMRPVSGPFSGVPFLLKDLLASYAGVPIGRQRRTIRLEYDSPVACAGRSLLEEPGRSAAVGCNQNAGPMTRQPRANPAQNRKTLPPVAKKRFVPPGMN